MKIAIQLSLTVLTTVLVACSSASTSSGTADSLAVGQKLYQEKCASCHGLAGEGEPSWKQPNADGVYPAPPHDSSGHTWHHPDNQLLAIIAQGGMMQGSQMPGFADQMNEEEMRLVLEYIKSFWDERERTYQEQVTVQAESNRE